MGDGSRAEAIGPIGSVAHDIIQWFTADDYATDPLGQEESELLIEVDLPRTFDLLDILAICYTIQQCHKTSKYTLQRFNCYFYCGTILAILTRRIVDWENLITNEVWTRMVDNMLNELRQKQRQDDFEYLAVGICSTLDPSSSTPENFIIDSLRTELGAGARESLIGAITKTLWQEELPLAVKKGLSAPVDNAVNNALTDNSTSAVTLRTMIGSTNNTIHPEDEFWMPTANRALVERFSKNLSNAVRHAMTSRYSKGEVQHLEHRPSLVNRLLASTVGPVVGPFMVSSRKDSILDALGLNDLR
jgi:hypothetical protein